jgi:hypothetical protein
MHQNFEMSTIDADEDELKAEMRTVMCILESSKG